MKKFLYFIIIAIMMLMPKSVFAFNYDSQILSDAKAYTDLFDYENEDINPFYSNYYFIVNEKIGLYRVNINGVRKNVYVPLSSTLPASTPINILDLSLSERNLIEKCLQKVYDYVDSSLVLTDKTSIHDFLSDIVVKKASFNDNNLAYFDTFSNTIYFSDNSSELIVIREYIKAISYYTHNCAAYTYELIDEACVDLISNALVSKDNSENQLYAPIICPFINFFGLDALSAFYYGYDKINYENKDELDLLILSINNFFTDDFSTYYNNIMYKWYASK